MSDPEKADRRAMQLRANLARRKQQARDAAAADPGSGQRTDQPEGAGDPSDVVAPAA